MTFCLSFFSMGLGRLEELYHLPIQIHMASLFMCILGIVYPTYDCSKDYGCLYGN